MNDNVFLFKKKDIDNSIINMTCCMAIDLIIKDISMLLEKEREREREKRKYKTINLNGTEKNIGDKKIQTKEHTDRMDHFMKYQWAWII